MHMNSVFNRHLRPHYRPGHTCRMFCHHRQSKNPKPRYRLPCRIRQNQCCRRCRSDQRHPSQRRHRTRSCLKRIESPTTPHATFPQKYAGRCAWPGCIKLPEIYHHTQRFALYKDHNPAHITPLCKNHERLAHHGLIKNEESAPENWQILAEPDKNQPKYFIDSLVQKFRMGMA